MNAARIELALVLDGIGLMPIGIAAAERRFDLHMRVYLAQVAGADLGYRYRWLFNGPYCRALTNDAFILRDELADGERDFEGFTLRPSIIRCLAQVHSLAAAPGDFRGTINEWLHLSVSLHYVRHIVYQPGGIRPNFDDAASILTETIPRFGNRVSEMEQAWRRLEAFGLIAEKRLKVPRRCSAVPGAVQ